MLRRTTDGEKPSGALEELSDKRITWMEQRINSSLKLKPAEMKKLTETEEYRQILLEFLDQPDKRSVFIVGTASGSYAVVNNEVDVALKGSIAIRRKCFYFLKSKREKIADEKSIAASVSCGDVCADLLQSFHHFAERIVLPLLQDRANRGSVPEISHHFLMEHTHDFLSQSLMTYGRSRGLTILPIPPMRLPRKIAPETVDKEVAAQLEGAVVQWSASIRAAMAAAPEDLPALLGRPAGPLDELNFWKAKRDDLAQLQGQLSRPFIAKTTVYLRLVQSSYYQGFNALSLELTNALQEAAENYSYLKPLGQLFEQINAATPSHLVLDDLVEKNVFREIFHLLFVAWCHSSTFSSVHRMVHLISCIANDLISNVRESINVQDVFQQDADDVAKVICSVLNVCGEFKRAFFFYKAKSAKELQRPWRFQNTALFKRLDDFLERCHDLLDIIETSGLFFRLATARIGGSASIELSNEIEAIQAKYTKAFAALQNANYDMLDIADTRFERDYNTFRSAVGLLEQQLAVVMSKAISDTNAVSEVFKVVDTFDGFTSRPIVHQEWADRQAKVLEEWHQDLLEVRSILQAHKESPVVLRNLPFTVSTILWAEALSSRISAPYSRIMDLSKSILESPKGDEALRLYELLRSQLKQHVHSSYDTWASSVGQMSTEKLHTKLVARCEDGQLAVNFDPLLVRTLREASYFDTLATDNEDVFVIPPSSSDAESPKRKPPKSSSQAGLRVHDRQQHGARPPCVREGARQLGAGTGPVESHEGDDRFGVENQ